MIEVFKKHLKNQDIAIKAEVLKSAKTPAVVNVEEFMRRMSEMSGFYGMEEADTMKNATHVLNVSNPVVASICKQSEEKQALIVNQIYYLAMLSFKKLSPEELSDFMNKSNELLFHFSK